MDTPGDMEIMFYNVTRLIKDARPASMIYSLWYTVKKEEKKEMERYIE